MLTFSKRRLTGVRQLHHQSTVVSRGGVRRVILFDCRLRYHLAISFSVMNSVYYCGKQKLYLVSVNLSLNHTIYSLMETFHVYIFLHLFGQLCIDPAVLMELVSSVWSVWTWNQTTNLPVSSAISRITCLDYILSDSFTSFFLTNRMFWCEKRNNKTKVCWWGSHPSSSKYLTVSKNQPTHFFLLEFQKVIDWRVFHV